MDVGVDKELYIDVYDLERKVGEHDRKLVEGRLI